MLVKQTNETEKLETFFAAARDAQPFPDAALAGQVLMDAEQELQRRTKTSTPVSWVRSLLRDMGGWRAIAGLVTATFAGIWLGVSPPTSLDVVAQSYFASDVTGPLFDVMATDVFGAWEGAL